MTSKTIKKPNKATRAALKEAAAYLKEKFEDAGDYQEAKRAYEEHKKSKAKTIPYTKIKKKFKL